jgi:hypothetical protein
MKSCKHDGNVAIERVGDVIHLQCLDCGWSGTADDSPEEQARLALEAADSAKAGTIATWGSLAGILAAAIACVAGAYGPAFAIALLSAPAALMGLYFRRHAVRMRRLLD